MRSALLLALGLLSACGAAFSPRPTAEIIAAFDADGYDVVTNTSLCTGQRGFVALSRNTTNLRTVRVAEQSVAGPAVP
jgi:hypothetical protein